MASLVSVEVHQCVSEWKDDSLLLMLVKVKFGWKLCVLVSVYGPGSEKDEEEMETFFYYDVECLQSFPANVNVLFRDLDTIVDNVIIEDVVGMLGVPEEMKIEK